MSDIASMPWVSVFILTALSLGGSQASDSPNISSGNQSNVTKHLRLYDNAQFFDHLLNITKYNPRVRPDTTVEVED